jgi:hypothetical protein
LRQFICRVRSATDQLIQVSPGNLQLACDAIKLRCAEPTHLAQLLAMFQPIAKLMRQSFDHREKLVLIRHNSPPIASSRYGIVRAAWEEIIALDQIREPTDTIFRGLLTSPARARCSESEKFLAERRGFVIALQFVELGMLLANLRRLLWTEDDHKGSK